MHKHLFIIMALACGLAACGHKGVLEPSDKTVCCHGYCFHGDIKSVLVRDYAVHNGHRSCDTKIVYDFDERGRLVKSIEFTDGFFFGHTRTCVYAYDDRDSLLSVTYYKLYGQWRIKREAYAYDDRGFLSSKMQFSANDEMADWEMNFEHDEQGNLIRETEYNALGLTDGGYLQTFDDRNRLITYVTLDDELQPVDSTLYTYDDKGNLISEVAQNSSYCNVYTYQYDDRNCRIRSVFADGDGYVGRIEHYSYDADGRLIEKLHCNGRDEILERFEYEYNERGNLLREAWYEYDGTLRNYQVYDYDEFDNIVSETYYDADGQVVYLETFRIYAR